MARVHSSQREIVVRLNPIEQFLALRRSVRVPLSLVRSARVLDDPLDSAVVHEVKMGMAARTAPGQKLICCGPRATWRGGKALIIVYGNRRSLVVELDESSPKWRLVVVSMSNPDVVANNITAAARPS